MKRPLFISMIFLMLGIFCGTYISNKLIKYTTIIIITLICVIIYKTYKTKSVFIFISIYIFGLANVQNSLEAQNLYIDHYVKQEKNFTIDARVIDSSLTKNGRQRVVLLTSAFHVQDTTIIETMKIQAVLDDNTEVNIGQYITVQGKLVELSRIRNPGGFDQFQYLRARKIQYTMFPQVVSFGDTVPSVQAYLHNIRNRLINVYDTVLPEVESGIIKSMILGDKSDLNDDLVMLYRISGIYHILVISGLHISILIVLINKMLDRFLAVKLSAIITLIFIIFYCMLVGSGVSVVRAVTMAGIHLVGKIIDRDRDFITTIAFAAICLLIHEPLFLWDIGFQFSFIAVFGIAIATEPIDRLIWLLLRNITFIQPLFNKEKFRKSFAVSVTVFLSISPLSIYYFYYFMPYSILANIIIILTANVLVILGFSVGVIGLISLTAAEILSGGIYAILKVYEKVVLFFSSLPGATILIGKPSIIFIIGFYIVFGCLIYTLSAYNENLKKRIKYFAITLSTYLILIFLNNIRYTGLEVTFLDVGQGESIVIQLNNEVYIIDGGGVRNKEIGENKGSTVLLPFLDNRGINYIDTVFVTHEDADHIVGIIELIGNKEIGQILTTFAIDKEDELYLMLEYKADKHNVPIGYIGDGDAFQSKGGIIIEVIYPVYGQSFRDINDTSLVMSMEYKGVRFLFTGDIDMEAELDIIRRGRNVSAHVLNVAHHGSKFSTADIFLNEVSPTIGVVSAGKNNVFGHPSLEVIEKFEESNIPLYSTVNSGAVIIRTKGDTISVIETYK